MRPRKQSLQLARHLLHLSLEDGRIAAARVDAVLAFLREHPPRQPLAVLKHYSRLVAREVARSEAVVEHAGQVNAGLLHRLEAALTRKYRRPIAAAARPNPDLIAGLRIRVGDDLYESSVAGQLTALAAAG